MILKQIETFPGYWIGDDGSVWSQWWKPTGGRKSRPREMQKEKRQITQTDQGGGYMTVQLSRNGKKHRITVHKLVLTTFIGPCPPGKEAAHDNGISSDNRLSNLEWKTPKQNSEDKKRHGTHLIGENAPGAELTLSQVRELRKLRAWGLSLCFLAKKFGVRESTVSRIANRVRWRDSV